MARGLSISNPHPQKLPGPALLHHLVLESHAGLAIEYCSADGTTSHLDYKELQHRANTVAHRLIDTCRNGDTSSQQRLIIPVFIPQCPDLYVSQIASLKAGGAFCPISLDVPEERLRFILKDIGAQVLLTVGVMKDRLPKLEGVEVIAVDSIGFAPKVAAPNVAITPEHAAYIMYTSGSTGQPKGVILSHSAATQALLAHDRHIPHFSRFLQFASPTFDVSVFEIFFPLFRGRTLVCCDRRRLLNDLPGVISDLQIDAAELTPSVASSLLRKRANVPTLKVLLTIGEMLKPNVVEEFGGSSEESAILYGMYGPTEATIHCTLQPAFGKGMPCGNIGMPLDTVSAFVVRPLPTDKNTASTPEILPMGEEGELAVGGWQLADGYLNRDEQTRLSFVEHPTYGRLYRTGDRAKMWQDGRFECLGRISNGQVKLRGQRIELGEIEHAALRTKSCQDAAAEVVNGILVVFCAFEESDGNVKDVLTTCRKWLPSFMVPGDVVILQSLPYLPSGKLDRKALRNRYMQQQSQSPKGDQTEDEMTRTVVRVLIDTLGSDVSSSSQLPSLGLDSISSIRIASALSREGLPRLDASRVLTARTVRELVDAIERAENVRPDSDQLSGLPNLRDDETFFNSPLLRHVFEDVERIVPCTATQASMLSITSRHAQMYCNWVELSVPKLQSGADLVEALRTLSAHHQMLRTGFLASENGPWTFVNVVWKCLRETQITQVSRFDYDFRISGESDLLHPFSVQIMRTKPGLRMLLKVHHALYDQWSLDVLRSDLGKVLENAELGTSSSFTSVSDYHLNAFDETKSADAFEFWQSSLQDVAPTPLPVLRGQKVPSKLSRTSWSETSIQTSTLRTRSRELGCSAPAVFQAAIAVLLSAYIGTTDVTFGSVFSGRTIPVPGIESVFGPCLATLPLRIDVSSAHTCRDLLHTITDLNRTVQKHILTPLTTIKEAARVSPNVLLFDTLFVWQENSIDMHSVESTVPIIDSADQLEFNLVLEFEPSSQGIKARATYQEAVFPEEQIRILLRQIECTAKALLDHPEGLVAASTRDLPSSLLAIANPEPVRLAEDEPLTSVLESRARSIPSATAIAFAHNLDNDPPKLETISYKDLELAANKTANSMITAGLLPDELVCICMEKSIELYVTILATLKAGAGYLPLIPETPLSRIESILEQAKPRFCVADPNLVQDILSVTEIRVFDRRKLSDSTTEDHRPPRVAQNGSRIAYAVFTSGTTGVPKGVAVTADNLHDNLAALGRLYKVQPGDRLLQSCSQAFDVSVFEIFFAFYSGMCLCSATKDVLFRDFEHSIRALNVTHLSLTPTVAALVEPENVPNVRFLVTAGEAVTEKVHRSWAGHGLNQGYGPSETTNICSVKMRVSPDDVLGNIGPPFRNTSAFVLSPDDDLRILPAGAYGEYAFGGEQVFRGYIGMDQLNSEKIVQHSQYGRIYRSGDMGRIMHDGTLLIAGRIDDQVKIRGNRIELGEISSVVLEDEGISDCATLVLGSKSSEQSLATFWVPAAAGQKQSSDLHHLCDIPERRTNAMFEKLEETLPAYMLPTLLIPVSRLPLTSQGKLDKRLLISICDNMDAGVRERFSHRSESTNDNETLSAHEQEIANALADVLRVRVSDVSRQSSFFGLGLNSLNAIALAKLLQSKTGVAIGVSSILRNPSVARLGRFLSQSKSTSRPRTDVPAHAVFSQAFKDGVMKDFAARRQQVDGILPCTPLQEVMLSASFHQHSSSYSNAVKLKVLGNVEKLLRCLSQMVERHAILRTTFIQTPISTHPYAQVLLKSLSLPVETLDRMTAGPTRTDASQPFKVRVATQAEQTYIYLHMHHAIYDGISMENLFREVERTYHGISLEAPVSFEPFLNEVMAQNKEEATEFWRAKFSDFRPQQLPNIENMSDVEEHQYSTILTPRRAELTMFCERHSVTQLSVIQAAWVKTLACLQNISDVCFGNVVSGRTTAVQDADRLVAPCFNTIPVRSQLDGLRSNMELVRSLHHNSIDTAEHELTALRRIQALSQSPSKHLFDSVILLQPPRHELHADVWSAEDDSGAMDLPIVIEVTPHHERLNLLVHFLGSKVPEDIVPAISNAFDAALVSCLRLTSSHIAHFHDFDSNVIFAKLKPVVQEGSDVPADDSTLTEIWTDVESSIRKIFADLSGAEISKIRRHTSLYQLGLDSLNAVQIASQMRGLRLHVDSADVMRLMTPADLARLIEDSSRSSAVDEPIVDLNAFERQHKSHILQDLKLGDALVEAIRPCTPAQSGMLSQSLQTDGKLYINHTLWLIPKDYSLGDIRFAWRRVQRRHQVLRMGFCQLDDSSTPFAMVIYRANSCASAVCIEDSNPGQDVIEASASKHIVRNIHGPAWQLLLLKGAENKMCLSIHHALYDAESLSLILADFAAAMIGRDTGGVVSIDPLLRSTLEGTARSKSQEEDFWRHILEQAVFTRFPSLTPTVVSDSSMQTVSARSKSSFTELEAFCREESVTVQALGQSIWATLLAAYTGEPRITFGTVFSAGYSSSRRAAFPNITTIPVTCDTSKKPLELVKNMVSYNSEIQKYRFAALSDIQRYASRPGRALFDTVFVYQKAVTASERQLDWALLHETAAVDFTVSMELETPSSEEVCFRLTFDSKVLPKAHAELLLQQYDLLLQKIVGSFAELESTFDPLMSALPPKDRIIPSPVALLHEFVERGAKIHPSKPAFEFVDSLEDSGKQCRTWSYDQLNRRGNQVARLIMKAGVKPGSIVAVCMNKSPEASFAFVGILKAGCAFLAMDPDLPYARKKFILEDSSSQLLFVDNGAESSDFDDVVQVVSLAEGQLARIPDGPIDTHIIDPSATCYCLYTSGTTGTPKGCELTHENAVQAMMSFQRLFNGRWTESSRWLQFASYWFDVSVLEQFWSWSVGIMLVGAPRDMILEDLAHFIRTARITHIDLTPSLARLLTPDEVPSLCGGVFITGGEALKQEIIDAWGPQTTICNGYGPTEATIGVTMNPFIGADAKPSNIGPQFDNVGSYVLKAGSDEPVMRGAVGELCVFGKLVGKGYLNRPELTDKMFPYLSRHNERFYRTGDLVRMLADGSFAFIGRQDTQAKLRGQRLEIDEIDAVVASSSDSISEVASLVIKIGEAQRETLVSFFVVHEQSKSRKLEVAWSVSARKSTHDAENACRDHLPGYMVPTHFVPISKLPLTVNNKVDIKQLISLFTSLKPQEIQALKGERVETRRLNAAEEKIASTLARILSIGQDQITARSNIFSLGLSSVSAIPFATTLKRSGFQMANVATIMKHPTLDGLAIALTDTQEQNLEQNAIKQAQLSINAFAQRYRGFAARALSVAVSDIEAIAPCTPLQEGLLVESTKTSERPYFNHFCYRIAQSSQEKLPHALSCLIESIPILRTVFIRTDEGYAQAVLKKLPSMVRHVELSSENSARSSILSHVSQWKSAVDEQDFIEPFRAIILSSASHQILTFLVHHAMYDGISWDLTMNRLTQELLSQASRPSPSSFLDALAYGPLLRRPDAKEFWQSRLGGTTYTPLPSIAIDASNTRIPIVHAQIPDSEAKALERIRKELGVSHQALFQAGFQLALHQFAPQTRLFGVVLSGRSIAFDNAETVIGPMFNTIPYGIEIAHEDTWSKLLLRCQNTNAAMLPFQHSSLRDIRRYCGRTAADPLFDALFVCQQQDDASSIDLSHVLETIDTEIQADYPLAFEVEISQTTGMKIMAVAQPAYATQQSLQSFVDNFLDAIRHMSADCQKQIKETFTISTEAMLATTNGHVKEPSQIDDNSHFEWTNEACTLRDSIAQLTGAESDVVTEHATIFALGLDSIDAVKLSARMKQAGLGLPVSKILQAQTIPRMLEAIQTSSGSSTPHRDSGQFKELVQKLGELPEIVELRARTHVQRILPATPSQEAMVADMVRSDFHQYFSHDIMRLDQGVDIERLESAWETVIHASPILRTGFLEISSADVNSIFAQVIHMKTPLQCPRISMKDLSGVRNLLDEIRVAVATSSSEAVAPFRLTFISTNADRFLLLSIAHALYDGHSLALLHDDVRKAYHDSFTSRPSYDRAVEAGLEATEHASLAFWRNALMGAKTTNISNEDKPAGAQTHRKERSCAVDFQAARSACQRLGVSMQTLVQTTYAVLIGAYVKSLEVMFGVVLACRDSESAEQIMFPMMNTVPLPVMLHGTTRELLQHVQGLSNSMLPYQRTPLRAIQSTCSDGVQSSTSVSRSGLFDMLFIYQNRPEADSRSSSSLYESIDSESSTEYPVAIEVEAVSRKLVIRAACKDHVMSEEQTENFIAQFEDILSFLIENPERPIVAFSGEGVSLCNLPAFELASKEPEETSLANGSHAASPMPQEDSTTLAIQDVLSQVAKISSSEIDHNTAIESIGIDSISAIKVTALLRKQNIKLTVSELLKAKTPGRMAEAVQNSLSQPAQTGSNSRQTIANALRGINIVDLLESAGVPISNVEEAMPTTSGQTYMLSLWRRSGGQIFYPTFKYALTTRRKPEDVHRAWSQLVAAHPILRTIFVASGNSDFPLLQVVLKQTEDRFSYGQPQDLHNLSQPYAALHAISNSSGYSLELKIHHSLYDAVSLPLLMRDFLNLLNEAPVQDSVVSFRDFVASTVASECRQSRTDFWTQYVRDVVTVPLPQPSTGVSQSKVEMFQPALYRRCDALEQTARRNRVTTQALLFAAYAQAHARQIKRVTGRQASDIVLGVYFSNRAHLRDLERLPAPTLNLVPLVVRDVRKSNVIKLAKQIAFDLGEVGSSENSGVALWEIEKWTGVTVDAFLNFLKLPHTPDEESSDEHRNGDNGSSKLSVNEGSRLKPRTSAIPASEEQLPKDVDSHTVFGDAYQHAVDIEMTISHHDLAFGLFAPEEMLGVNAARTMMEDLKTLLEETVKH